ncbi:MAG: tetratricopeptide repeat protein, partial [Myxococcota bacterium]
TEVLAMAHTLRDRWLEAVVLGHLGSLAQEEGQLDEAERCLRQALVHQRELGARPQEGLSLGYLGVLLHERGQLCEARDCYQRAIAVLDEVDDGLGVSYVWFHRAALEAAEGNIEAVAHCRRKADEGLGDLGSDKSAPMQAMVEAHVAYAQMRQALEEGRSQEAHRLEQTITTILAHMRQPEGELAPPVARFDGVRSMLRLVEQGLAQLQPPDGALLVCRDGGWFRPPHEAWIDYRRRRSLKRLLVALTEHRISAPGVGVELATMIEAGWPNEPLSEEVGANRVYVAVTTLRKAGLHDILHSSDTGWFLDAATPVLWADGPEEG